MNVPLNSAPFYLIYIFSFCSLIEVNGSSISAMNDQHLGQLLKEAKQRGQHLELVVLRTPPSPNPGSGVLTSQEFEIFKEDLSLALMELETANQDKKKLQLEVDR